MSLLVNGLSKSLGIRQKARPVRENGSQEDRYSDIKKVAFVADYVPRRCGIATFTNDLRGAVAEQYPNSDCVVAAVNDIDTGYEYPAEVRFEIDEQDPESYRRAADFLNFGNFDAISIQHEFGIFGGPAGSHILALMRYLDTPVVTTLHTVLREPNARQLRVINQLDELSARLVVMSESGKQMLQDVYGVRKEKIDLIAHGIPDMPFVDPNFYKDKFGVEGKYVLLTFGLLSPNKGIEHVLKALPEVIRQFPNLVYIILGATHPSLIRSEGESYRIGLERLAQDLGIKRHVIFHNRFVELSELKEFIGAADLYVTPYLNPAQTTSGTLAYAFGCGKAVISTPYWHAEELLAEDRGLLVPFGEHLAIGNGILELLNDETRRHAMRKRAYMLGREMIWSAVAHQYMDSFEKARRTRKDAVRRLIVRTLEEQQRELPPIRLDHLRRLTDFTGIFQHATYSLPNYDEGYCTDDCARAFLATLLLEDLGHDPRDVLRLGGIYAAFLNHAFDRERGRFRNFMTFDRHWLPEGESDDCQGRAVWALGMCLGRSRQQNLRMWAAGIFGPALSELMNTSSPRGWAFGLLGIHEYLRQLSGDRHVNMAREELANRLVDLFHRNSRQDWPWFEDVLTYDNAVLSHALILSGRWTDHEQAFDIGIRSLSWLAELQRAPSGHFRPIGSSGFYPYGGNRAEFDQQPIEAYGMTAASLEAYRCTNETWWLDQAWSAFEWFLGRNDLSQPVYDAGTGGCRDGLHVDRANQNQGAESTIAFLLARAEMGLIESTLSSFRQPEEPGLPSAVVTTHLEAGTIKIS